MAMQNTDAPSAPAIDAAALLKGAAARTPYVLADGASVPFERGIVARGVHTSQTDADGNPLPVLVYEPRGARAQLIPLAVVSYAIASGLISAEEIAALQAIGA